MEDVQNLAVFKRQEQPHPSRLEFVRRHFSRPWQSVKLNIFLQLPRMFLSFFFVVLNKNYTPKCLTRDAPAWCKQQEIILKKWSEEAMAYRYMHDRSYKHFAKLHMNFSLPVIIISTIAGTPTSRQAPSPPSTGSGSASRREALGCWRP